MIRHTTIKLLVWLLSAACLYAAPIDPKTVAVIYNKNLAQSKELAEFYCQMRSIPRANLIPLELSDKNEISRAEYQKTIRDPLRKIFTERNWWVLARNQQRLLLPSSKKINTLVCVRGVPYKIKRAPITEPNPPKLQPNFAKANEASVDSELSLLGVHGYSTLGPQQNPYFKKDTPIGQAKIPYIFLVGRIDSPSYEICKRMIGDAIATESNGLWGMCYLDQALKGKAYKIGDDWIENIYQQNLKTGIPTVIDRNKQTFVTNYPMTDAAIYYGWYTGTRNGPLLNSKFRFRRGAVAIHLHSFSAANLRFPHRNWCGPLLAKGAAATVGNVYEPYLQLTHQFDILHDRLLKGHTLVEAAHMALPFLSWQNVVLGDPLYRPFLHLNGSGETVYNDRDYRAIRVATQRWGNEPKTLVTKLRNAAASKANPKLYEHLGLWHLANNQQDIAIAFFQTAVKKHLKEPDQLRQWLYTADIHRSKGNKQLAIATLRKAKQTHGSIPEAKAATALLNILDPPPPPPASEVKKQRDKKKK